MKQNRCLIKLSGAAFGNQEKQFDFAFLKKLVHQVMQIKSQKQEIIIVVGGGNLCRGATLQKMLATDNDPDASFDYAGMLATLINGLILKNIFAAEQQRVRVLTDLVIDEKVATKYTQTLAEKCLHDDGILILVGGIGLPNFSTDVATFVKAKELKVNAVLLGKHRVDGVYSADPHLNTAAKWLPTIKFSELIERRLKIIDFMAATIGMQSKFSVFVFDIQQDNALLKVWNQEGKFTHVQNS